MQITKYYTFVDGKSSAGLINADRLNGNLDAIINVVNGNIEDDNIKTGAKVLVSDRNYTGANKITGSFEFDAFPTVPDDSIPDAKLSNNVPLINAQNTFSAKQTLGANLDMGKNQVEQIVIHKLATAPSSPTHGQIYYNTGDNKFYGWNGSQWNQMDYIGGYTGGAIRPYSTVGEVDDGTSLKYWFKTEGASPTVKIAIKGEDFPKRFYTELGYHNHTFTPTAHNHGVNDSGHTHVTNIGSHGHGSKQFSLGTHEHSVLGYTDYATKDHTHGVGTIGDDGHTHGAVTSGMDDTGSAQAQLSGATASHSISHRHQVSLSAQASSQKDDVDSATIGNKTSGSSTTGITTQNADGPGTIGYEGVNGGALSSSQKLYAKSLTIKIDGTDVTSDVLSATGWTAVGDGTGTHAFHTAGTGEMDASSWVTYSAGYHTLEIIEPESGYGSGIRIHMETS